MPSFDWSHYTGSIPWLPNRTIFLTRAGSHAYGTNIEGSDEDYRGVAIAPADVYLGIQNKFEQFESKGTEETPDMVVYEFRKFLKLASQSNPNIVELLFTDPSDHISLPGRKWGGMYDPFADILAIRHLFVTKRARATFAGYAHAQLKKIKHGTEHAVPGSARFERIKKFGYCTKNAMHLVRLLRMCREILETGEVNVRRKDAESLLAIRNGAWTLQELVQYAEQEDKDMDDVCRKSYLPEQPDMELIDRKCVEIMQGAMKWL